MIKFNLLYISNNKNSNSDSAKNTLPIHIQVSFGLVRINPLLHFRTGPLKINYRYFWVCKQRSKFNQNNIITFSGWVNAHLIVRNYVVKIGPEENEHSSKTNFASWKPILTFDFWKTALRIKNRVIFLFQKVALTVAQKCSKMLIVLRLSFTD